MSKIVWTPENNAELMRLKSEQRSWAEIAEAFESTEKAVKEHYRRIKNAQAIAPCAGESVEAPQPISPAGSEIFSFTGQLIAQAEETLNAYSKLLGNRTVHLVLNSENGAVSAEITAYDASNRCMEISVTRHGEIK